MEKLHPKSFICRRIYIGKTQNYQELTLGHIKMITWVSTLLHSHRSTTIREGQTQWWDFWYPQNFFWNIASWKTCAIHCWNLWILASALSVSYTLRQRAQYLLNMYLWIKQSLKEWLKNYVNILHTKLYFFIKNNKEELIRHFLLACLFGEFRIAQF